MIVDTTRAESNRLSQRCFSLFEAIHFQEGYTEEVMGLTARRPDLNRASQISLGVIVSSRPIQGSAHLLVRVPGIGVLVQHFTQ